MTISLQNHCVLITGGAVRLGRAIALACARAGASVAITYYTSEAAAHDTVAQMREIGARTAQFAALPADLNRAAEITRLPDATRDALGGATALVNNAAIFQRTPFAELTEAAFDAHINANLKAPYLLCKAFGDLFLAQERGAIVNIADIYGMKPLKNYVPYCVSKAGVVMLTQTLALALAPWVRVNCVCPGTILPPSQTQGEDDTVAGLLPKIPLQRLGEPAEIADAVLFLLGGPQFISGVALPVDGAQSLRA